MLARRPHRALLLATALAAGLALVSPPLGALAARTGTASVRPAPPPRDLVDLVDALAQRVALADEVAAAKFPSGAVEDPAREAVVLDDAAAKATAAGLDPVVARTVFADQIVASKVVQYGLFSRWLARPDQAPTAKPDLATVRPRLDSIGTTMVTLLAGTVDERAAPTCRHQVRAAGRSVTRARHLDGLHAAALHRGLVRLCG